MSLNERLQTALENLAQAARKLEAAGEKLARERAESAAMRAKNGELFAQVETLTAQLEQARENESENGELKEQIGELTAARNRLIAEKNQLLGEREQFKKFREGWAAERPALIKAKDDAENELRRLEQSAGESTDNGELTAAKAQIESLKKLVAELENDKNALTAEKERIAVERDGIQTAFAEIKETTRHAAERLDSTLEELRILKGDSSDG